MNRERDPCIFNGWEKVGGVGWDVGMIIVAAPENIYKLYDHLVHSQQINVNSFIDYLLESSYEKKKNELCSYGIVVFDNFGGDGAADIYVRKDKDRDTEIKIVFDDLDHCQSSKKQSYPCTIGWNNGMIFIGDPLALSDILEKNTTLESFLTDYAKDFEKHGFYQGFLTYIWIDNLIDQGSFKIYIENNPQSNYDSIITFITQKSMIGGHDTTPQKSELPTYTLEEVSKHNKKGDAWIALQGNVYDVTKWIPQHPGGDAILQCIGKDATDIFEGIGHPSYVYDTVRPNYLIGRLAP